VAGGGKKKHLWYKEGILRIKYKNHNIVPEMFENNFKATYDYEINSKHYTLWKHLTSRGSGVEFTKKSQEKEIS